tara:strand:- start:7041 stop:10460 length:3420 start_codon:yes stop_codon:yes gene_type:complete
MSATNIRPKAPSSKNSFATVAEEIINYNNNTLNLLTQMNSIMKSNDSSVAVDFTDNNRVLTTYDVPSWGYLTNEIQRLNNNINSLFSINESGAIIQTAENIYKKLILVDLNTEPNQIGSLNNVSNFESERNHFFDGLLNPNLRVRVDLNGKVEDDVRQVLVRRYILELERDEFGALTKNGQVALTSFNLNFRSKSNINIDAYVEWHKTTPGILNSTTPYFDQQDFPLEPNQLIYDGQFSVLEIEEDSLNKKLWYHLNTLNFLLLTEKNTLTSSVSVSKTSRQAYVAPTLSASSLADTVSATSPPYTLPPIIAPTDTNSTRELAEGDHLIINRKKTSTIYKVIEVSKASSNPRVRLERIQGVEAIPVGEGTLKIYSPTVNNKEVKITIGYGERNVIFMRPINSENYLLAKKWSAGTAFFTNDLTLTSDDTDNGKTMDEYYVDTVEDYGMAIKDLVQTKTPLGLGEIPNKVLLQSDNFKVVQINKHLTDNKDQKEIGTKYKKMKELKTEVSQLDNSIQSKRTEMRLSTFKSKNMERTFNNELKSLVSKKESSSRLLKTTTDEIITLSNSPNTNRKIKPKYRVRGFWDMPEAQLVRGSRPQEVVQFKIEYRYLSVDGNESQVQTFKLKNSQGRLSTNAAFSNWNLFLTDSRTRVFDLEKDQWVWEIEDTSDADTPNITQLDISIQKNERVEVRIKSFSEVGWPELPMESGWSEILTIDFPEDLSSILGEDEFILLEASREDTIVQLKSELNNVDEHLSDGVSIGDTDYFHSSDSILAGIPDDKGNQQSLLNYLRYLVDKVESLEEQINRTRGILQVYVYRGDEEFSVPNDTELQFNVECEDYLDKYDASESVIGRVYRNNIYTIKDFYLKVVNASSSSPLGLLSNRTYATDPVIYSRSSPQSFWINDRDELLYNTSSGVTNNQLNYQYLWNVNFDSGNTNKFATTITNKLSENIGNDFTIDNSNSITSILSSSEYNVGYNESTILEFVGNNNSLLDIKKWTDISPSVKSANKLLTTVHPSVQNLEDLVENNTDKVKSFKTNQELIIPINIYFKMNALDPNDGSGRDSDYIDLNNTSSTTRHIKKVKFLLENEAENKPFIFRVKFTINRNKVVVQKLGKNNKLTSVSQFKYQPFNQSVITPKI